MKIIKRIDLDFERETLEIESYPHVNPVVEKGKTDEELQTFLEEWKINQNVVDKQNGRTTITP